MGGKQRRAVMRTIRDTLRLNRSDALIAKPDQGQAVECLAAHPASSHFLRDGDFMSERRWWQTNLMKSRDICSGSDLLNCLQEQEISGQYRNFIRMSSIDFEYLINLIGEKISKQDTNF
ncbi:hypothetical protein QTP88_019295 [Uroleucon formosanum]